MVSTARGPRRKPAGSEDRLNQPQPPAPLILTLRFDDAAFARLASLHDSLIAAHPGATWRSAGMSGDLESALAHGATHVRVGSAILGARPAAR